MARSSGNSSASSSSSGNSDNNTSGSENSTDEEFVVKEKKIHYRLKGDGETHVPTKKSHSEGRRYRKQVSSSSSGNEETIAKKQRVLSSVVVKGKKGSSSDEDEYKNRKLSKSEKQKLVETGDDDIQNMRLYEKQKQGEGRDRERNKERYLKEYDKRRDFNDYNYDISEEKRVRNEPKKRNQAKKDAIKREHVKKEEYDSHMEDNDTKPYRSKYKIEEDRIKSEDIRIKSEDIKKEHESESDSKEHRKRKNEHRYHKIKHEKKYKEEDDTRSSNRHQLEPHEYSNHRNQYSGNHKKQGANSDWNVTQNKEGEPGATNNPPVAKEEENYELSGKLTEYTNTYNGVVIIYNEPPEARKPKTRWRFYPFKGEKALTMLQLHRQSAFLLGRDRKVADIPVDHPSCSKQHAVLQFRLVPCEKPNGDMGKKVKPYIIDLDSRNGTHVNNNQVEARKYVELRERDVIKFGFSSRDYVLLHEKSEDVDSAEDEGEN